MFQQFLLGMEKALKNQCQNFDEKLMVPAYIIDTLGTISVIPAFTHIFNHRVHFYPG